MGSPPNLLAVGLSQLVVRALVTACTVILTVIAVEEMPAGARAFGISLLGLCGAFGVGICLMALPLADLGAGGWRLLWFLAAARPAGRGRESAATCPRAGASRRPTTRSAMAGHGGACACWPRPAFLLAALRVAGLAADEPLPARRAGLLGHPHQRVQRPHRTRPAFLGVVVGGRIADLHGRRLIGAVARRSAGAGLTR